MLILDGVYTQGPDGPRFHRVTALDTKTLKRLLNRLIQRIVRRLSRDGLLIEDTEQPLAQLALNLEPSDALGHLNAASIRYRIAVGQGAGGRTLTLKNPALARTDSTPKPFTANQDGFSLNCAVARQPHQRDRLKRLCRYITRPVLCLDRLSVNTTGQVVYPLKNPFREHSEPTDKRANSHHTTAITESLTAPLSWAERLKRVFNIDTTPCPLCAGKLRVIEDVTDSTHEQPVPELGFSRVIERMQAHDRR
jgi:Putative transposase